MAKELILLPKRKYEELLKSTSVVRQEASNFKFRKSCKKGHINY